MKGKLQQTEEMIKCWVESWGVDNVYVAYSGGKDSEVLLHIVRKMYPTVKAVFSNTGLEFPEIVKHVRSRNNVTLIRPRKTFKQVITDYGWPIISKTVSMSISRYNSTKHESQREYRLNGKKQTAGVIPQKWKFLLTAPFKISDNCCYHLKKSPFKVFERKTGLKPMLGITAADSHLRLQDIRKRGCNVYDAKAPQSRPLSMWTEREIWEYIKDNDLEVCSVYSMGYTRTGCIFCMYGLHQESKKNKENRFQLLKKTHPKQWKFIIKKMKAEEVLKFLGLKYK